MSEERKIICINTDILPGNEISPSLELNKEYNLIDIYTCECGEKHYNVGLKMEVNYVRCYKCEEELPDTNHWCHSSRFNKD